MLQRFPTWMWLSQCWLHVMVCSVWDETVCEYIGVCINVCVAARKWSRNWIFRLTASYFRKLTFNSMTKWRWMNILFVLCVYRNSPPDCSLLPRSTDLMTSLWDELQGGNFMHFEINQKMTVHVHTFTPGWRLCPSAASPPHLSFQFSITNPW